MNHLLLVAHGSRRADANQELLTLAATLAQRDNGFDAVRGAFLELAEPSIPQGIRDCVEAGATRVVVLPYFLTVGRHVAEDIPRLVDEARESLPGVEIELATYLGARPAMLDLMLNVARDSAASS